MSETLLMGHRGWATKYPENTLRSFKAALDLGIEILEFDVRLSADGAPVIMHDDTVDRTSDGHGAPERLTLAELKRLDAGSWKSKEFAGERIPTLDETLELLKAYPDVLLNVEIKGSMEAAALATLKTIEAQGMMERCYFACFDANLIEFLKNAAPGCKTQGFPSRMMSNFKRGKNGTYSKMDYVGIYVGHLTQELVDGFLDIGITTGAWCADDKETLDKCLPFKGVSIVTSNAPGLIKGLLAERAER